MGMLIYEPTRLLSPWNFQDKNTRMDCHFLLQGIFRTQGLNRISYIFCNWQAGCLPLNHQGSPI